MTQHTLNAKKWTRLDIYKPNIWCLFVFVFCVGSAVTHRIYCSLLRLIVLTPVSFPLSSPEALLIRRRERPLLAGGSTMGEKCPIKFSHTSATSMVIVEFFYMPQICDMGQTALLPLRRKACWVFFRRKNQTASPGFEPANLGTRVRYLLSSQPFVMFYTTKTGFIWFYP
jgi:hypothetical protein